MARQAYSFRVAYKSEDEIQGMTDNVPVDPSTLVLTILPNGLPSYKTIRASGETEDEALKKAEAYVSKTPYREIEDGKLVQ